MVLPVRSLVNDGPIVTDAPKPLFPVQVSSGISDARQYAVSDDGQRFLVNAVTESSPDVVTVIVNWSPPK